MACPYCPGEGVRYRSPVYRDGVVLRRHRCTTCGSIFLSAQVVVDQELTEDLQEAFNV